MINPAALDKLKHIANMTKELNKIKTKKYDWWFKLARGKEQLGYITQIKTINSLTLIAYYISDDLQVEGWRRITFDVLPTKLSLKTIEGTDNELSHIRVPPVTNSPIIAIHV